MIGFQRHHGGNHVIPCTLRVVVESATSTDPQAAIVQFVVESK
jgi:hypothetical protein